MSATIGFLRHLEYLTTTADGRKTLSRLQSFHKWGVLGSSMLLSRESGTQLSSGNLPSSGHKKSKTQRTGMIQVGRHAAQLVESGVYFYFGL